MRSFRLYDRSAAEVVQDLINLRKVGLIEPTYKVIVEGSTQVQITAESDAEAVVLKMYLM